MTEGSATEGRSDNDQKGVRPEGGSMGFTLVELLDEVKKRVEGGDVDTETRDKIQNFLEEVLCDTDQRDRLGGTDHDQETKIDEECLRYLFFGWYISEELCRSR